VYQRLFLFLLLISFIACEENVPVIEVIDFDQYSMVGVTVEKQQEHYELLTRLIELKTEKHAVPNVHLKDSNDKEAYLLELIENKKCVLLVANSTCPACDLAYLNNFPQMRDSLEKKGLDYNFIPIMVRNDRDFQKVERFTKKVKELEKLYSNVYIISDTTANKFNIYGFPVQLYVNKKGIVEHYELGGSHEMDSRKLAKVLQFFDAN